MLSVKTNKNILNFKASYIGGFDLIQSAGLVVSFIVGGGLMFTLLMFTSLPDMLATIIPMPIIILPLTLSFYKKDGMGFIKHNKVTRQFKKMQPCTYSSTENFDAYNDMERIFEKNSLIKRRR